METQSSTSTSTSKVYLTNADNIAWLVYPIVTPRIQALEGETAQAILSKADYRGVRYYQRMPDPKNPGRDIKKEGYSFHNKDWSWEHFLSTPGFPVNKYELVVKELEQLSGRQNLTIVLS